MITLSGPQIKSKEIVGTLNGKPLTMVETIGGLHLIVMAKSGEIKTLGIGPHRAISMFIAEKREPDIVWAEHMIKSERYIDSHCPTCHQEDRVETCLCLLRWGYGS